MRDPRPLVRVFNISAAVSISSCPVRNTRMSPGTEFEVEEKREEEKVRGNEREVRKGEGRRRERKREERRERRERRKEEGKRESSLEEVTDHSNYILHFYTIQ